MNDQTNRIPSLDGLRAISIAIVIFSHFSGAFCFELTSTVGNFGVRVFFVISGFLITSILAGEIEKTSHLDLKKFYFRRILRIFPAYYFYIFFLSLLTVLGLYSISISDFLSPLTYTSNYFFPTAWELGHTWSLSVEEQFYLLFPGILLFWRINKTKKILLAVLLITPIIRLASIVNLNLMGVLHIPYYFNFRFHTNMDVLASGCLLALYRNALHENEYYQKFLQSTAPFLLLLFIIYLVASNSAYTLAFYGIGLTIMNISIVLCIDWLITNHQNSLGQVLNSKPFVFVGAMSYSLYLWQQPFSNYSEELIWTHYPLNIVLMIIFSLFSYYVIERNFLRQRQTWEKSLFSKKPEKTVLRTDVC